MTTTTAPESTTAAPDAQRPTGPLARVVATAIGAGLLGALLLTLAVFPGAAEPTILGSTLLSFGAGWALLAWLSARWTSSPQRWAVVPAVAMSGTGALVLAVSPGATALDRLGWVWPPLLLVLAVWMARRARQQLRTRARTWLVLPVIAVLALSAVGGGYETVRAAADRQAIAAPGRLVDIGGRSLHLRCSGSGGPAVVLLNGLGEHSTSWAWVTRRIARTTTVCAYDRAGQAWSDDAPQAPDGRAVAADLHALMARAGVPGPYVLAGHSTGGLYAQVFAQRYPQDVAGVVLLDSLTPRAMTALATYPRFYATFRRGSALMPSLARIGLGQVVFAGAGSTLPAAERRAEHAIQTSPREQRSGRAEFAALRATFAQAGQLTGIGDVPLAVVTAGRSMQSGWLAEQRRMATLSSNAVQRTVPWEHADLVWDRTGSAASSDAIEAVVAAARSGGPVAASLAG